MLARSITEILAGIDIARGPWDFATAPDVGSHELGAAHVPRLYVLNKVEVLRDKSELAALYRHAPKAIPISALTGTGLDDLETTLLSHLATCEETVDILVPHSAGALRAEIRTTTTVLSEEHGEEGSLMRIRSNPRLLGQILARGARGAGDTIRRPADPEVSEDPEDPSVGPV